MGFFTKVATVGTLLGYAASFPTISDLVEEHIRDPQTNECNTGIICSHDFSDEQLVSVHGYHEYKKPLRSDIRGPCPGLNAASNHAYLPRTGIASITETITGLHSAYGMAIDLSGFLAAVAVALTGDFLTESWSIGGPMPYNNLGGLLTQPQGISYSHNKYESDASVGRYDAYLNNGNAHSLNVSRFGQMFDTHNKEGEYNLENLRRHFNAVREYSVHNNPYFFFAPFAGLVAPAAHEFVINFMSNHSADRPSGYLNGDMLKTFFAVSGERDNFVWNKGQEHIPEAWYRRPFSNPYSAEKNLADTAITATIYPSTLEFGGNTGTTNSFTGVDIGNLTGGVFDGATLLKGNNLGCFMFQTATVGLLDEGEAPLKKTQAIKKLLEKYTGPLLTKFECPKLQHYNQGLFNKFPGYHYNPKGKRQNF